LRRLQKNIRITEALKGRKRRNITQRDWKEDSVYFQLLDWRVGDVKDSKRMPPSLSRLKRRVAMFVNVILPGHST
jgi:hypothetical protein